MRHRFLLTLLILNGLMFASCATVDGPSGITQELATLAASPNIANFPYQTTEDGIILLPVAINGQPPQLFAVDTGATRSALFRRAGKKIEDSIDDREIRIHGMVDSSHQPMRRVSRLQIGQHEFTDIDVAILADRSTGNEMRSAAQGLIGLDVLSKFRLYLDADLQQVSLIPNSEPQATKPRGWKYVPLEDNPYLEDGRALKFMKMRIQGRLSPALLDSGSSINLMNWEIAQDPRLKAFRRRLRSDWELEGAVGSFNPSVGVKVVNFRSGEKFWKSRRFIIKDIESLNILGIAGKPFIIAGVDLFGGQSFYLDFENNTLFLRNDPADKATSTTGTRVNRSGGPADSVAPIVRN